MGGQDQCEIGECSAEGGAVMVIVLMVLVLLTMGGMSAVHLSVTESYIVRNAGLHAQNRKLAEMAAMEGLREILGERDPSMLDPGARDWIWETGDWDNAASGSLPSHGYAVPRAVSNKAVDVIETRGETNADTLRYYVAGWTDADGDSIGITNQPVWQKGRIIGVYDSPHFGRAWVEVGVVKKF